MPQIEIFVYLSVNYTNVCIHAMNARARHFYINNSSRVFQISTLGGLKFTKNNTQRLQKTAYHPVPNTWVTSFSRYTMQRFN